MSKPTFSEKVAQINIGWVDSWVKQGKWYDQTARRYAELVVALAKAREEVARLRADLDSLTYNLYDASKRVEEEREKKD